MIQNCNCTIYVHEGDPSNIDNYRPISLLSGFSKLYERIMYKRLYTFVRFMKIIPESQHGFHKGRGVDTARFEFITDIDSAMDQRELIAALLIDSSKTYHSLNRKIFFEKLYRVGLRSVTLERIASYFRGRTQIVRLLSDDKEFRSDVSELHVGVPEGSVLEPLLFKYYFCELVNSVIECKASLVNYADDTNVLKRTDPLYSIINISSNIGRNAEK